MGVNIVVIILDKYTNCSFFRIFHFLSSQNFHTLSQNKVMMSEMILLLALGSPFIQPCELQYLRCSKSHSHCYLDDCWSSLQTVLQFFQRYFFSSAVSTEAYWQTQFALLIKFCLCSKLGQIPPSV